MTPTRTGEGFGTLVCEPITVAVVGFVFVAVPDPTGAGPMTVVTTTVVLGPLVLGPCCPPRVGDTLLPTLQLVRVIIVVVDRVTVAVRPPDPTVAVTVAVRPATTLWTVTVMVLTRAPLIVTVDVTAGAVTVTTRPSPPPPTVTVSKDVSHRVAVTVTRVAQTDTVTVDGSASDGAGHVTLPSPQAPNAVWHSVPQYASSFPQYPCAEQQRPQTDPSQVIPLPQLPSVLISSATWFDTGVPAATTVETHPRPRRQARTAARGRDITKLSMAG